MDHAAASDPAVRMLDAAAFASLAELKLALAADASPALVLVATPAMEAEVLPLLRPQDDLARAGDGAVALETRSRRLAERQRAAGELTQRRAHVDPLTGLPDRLRCLEWFGVDENAWTGERVRGLPRGPVHQQLGCHAVQPLRGGQDPEQPGFQHV